MNNSVNAFLEDQPNMNEDSDILSNIPRASPPITYDETEMPVKGTGAKKGAPTKDDRKLLEELLPSPAGFVISHIEHGTAVYIGRYTFDDVRSKGSIEMWIADNFRDQYGGGEYHVFPIEPKTGKPGEIPRVYKIAHTNSGPQVNENAMASVLNKTLEMIGTKEPRVERTVERVERAPAPMPAPVQNPVEILRDTHNLLKEMNPAVVAKPEDNSIPAMMIQMQLQAQKMQHEREQAALDREAKREAAAQATQIAMAQAAAQAAAQKPSGPDPALAAALEKLNRLEQFAMMSPPPPPPPPAPTGFDFNALLSNPVVLGFAAKFLEPKPDNTAAILQAMQASNQQQAELARAAADRQAELQRQAQKEQLEAQRQAAERQERIQREEQARQEALAAAAQARHEALIMSLKPKEDTFSLKDLLAMQKADADRAFAIQKENSDRTIAMLSGQAKNSTSFMDEVEKFHSIKSVIEQISPPSEAPEAKDSTVAILNTLAPVLQQGLSTIQKYLEKRPVQTVMMPAPRQLAPNPMLQQGQPVQTQGLQNVQVAPASQPQTIVPERPHGSDYVQDLSGNPVAPMPPQEEMTTDQKVAQSLVAIQAATSDKDRIDAVVDIFQSNMSDETLGPTAVLLGKFIIQNRDNQAVNLVCNFLASTGIPSGLLTQETVEATAEAMFTHWEEIRKGLIEQVPLAEMFLGEGKILKVRESDMPDPVKAPAQAASSENEESEDDDDDSDDDDDDSDDDQSKEDTSEGSEKK